MILHVIRDHWPAPQLKRVFAESDGGKVYLANYADEVSGQCDVCRAFDAAPHVPIAGTSTVSMFDGKLQADSLFLGNLIALNAAGVCPMYSHPAPRRSKCYKGAPAAFCSAGARVFGDPKCVQMGEGGEWENGVRTYPGSARRIRIQYQGVGARHWILDRRRGLARGFSKLLRGGWPLFGEADSV